MNTSEQLQMNFDTPSGNRFRNCLEHGIFTVLFEHAAPGMELPDDEAAARLAALEAAVLGIRELPCALALTDTRHVSGGRRAVRYAALLPEAHRNSHVVYVSGQDTAPADAGGLFALARAAHLANLVLVSGNARSGENARNTRKRPFTESVAMLKLLAEQPDAAQFHPGAVVNPGHYYAPALYAGLFKMVKKLRMKAQFIVAQAGFDMAQLDALRQFMVRRSLFDPLLCRLILLTPERVEKIAAGAMPGVTISEDFRAILDKELRFSASQFEAAQYRRLELQAAGCRLLGCTGVQISGVESAEKMRFVANRIHAALKEFTSPAQWVEEYNSYLARTDMARKDGIFYLYRQLLVPAERDVAVQAAPVAEFPIPKAKFAERVREKAARFFFPEALRQDAGERRWLKHLLAGCRGCSSCRLPQTQFICPEHCPKHLSNGPCGGVRDSGFCEVGNFPCVHLTIWERAERRRECETLEETFVPPAR